MVITKLSETLRNICDTNMTYPNKKIINESQKNPKTKYRPDNFLFVFQAMKGKFLTLACWKVIKMEGVVCWEWKWNADGMKGNGINKNSFNLATLK